MKMWEKILFLAMGLALMLVGMQGFDSGLGTIHRVSASVSSYEMYLDGDGDIRYRVQYELPGGKSYTKSTRLEPTKGQRYSVRVNEDGDPAANSVGALIPITLGMLLATMHARLIIRDAMKAAEDQPVTTASFLDGKRTGRSAARHRARLKWLAYLCGVLAVISVLWLLNCGTFTALVFLLIYACVVAGFTRDKPSCAG